jgi:hypothetical protein|nr:MAG TPA: hypothetical protein [Caudoviricetes sp.]
MGKTTKKSQLLKEYNKERNRIKRFIRNAEKRGYVFEPNLIPPKPKTITSGSVRRLSKIRPSQLYNKAYAISAITGQPITVEQRKREIKSEASRKAWETRRRKKDQEDYNRIKSNREWKQMFDASRLVWDKIQSLIANVGVQQSQSADLLNNLLNSEIEKYGADTVLYSIAQASEDFLATCEVIIRYHPSSAVSRTAVQHLYTLISGNLPSDAEQAEIDKALASDETWEEI